jgi:hypothetical protein
VRTVTSNATTIDVQCNAGETALGGGAIAGGPATNTVKASQPLNSGGTPATAGQTATGWRAVLAATNGGNAVYAICAAP